MTVPIWKSRKFLIMMTDVVISLIVTICGWYLAPEVLDRIITIVGILQAPIVFVIGAIAYEDAALKRFIGSLIASYDEVDVDNPDRED